MVFTWIKRTIILKAKPFLRDLLFSVSPRPARGERLSLDLTLITTSEWIGGGGGSEISSFSVHFTL